MEKNKMLSKLFDLFLGNILVILINALTIPLMTRIISTEAYGEWTIFNTYTNIVVIVVILGLDQAFIRFYYEYPEEARGKLLKVCCCIPIALCLILGAIGTIFIRSNDEVNGTLISLFMINNLLLIINKFALSVIRMEQKTKMYSALNVVGKVTYIVFTLGLLQAAFLEEKTLFILAHILSTLSITMVGLWVERKTWFRREKTKTKIEVKELVTYAYPYLFSFSVTWIFQSADNMAIKQYMGATDLGVYSSAMNIVNILSVLQNTFATIWVPIALEHYMKHKEDTSLFVRTHNGIALVMGSIGILLICFKDLLILFLGENYRGAAYALPFLIFIPIMYTLSETTVMGINFMKKSNSHIYISIGACIFNVIGNQVLVPIIGIKGAALSTAISYIAFFSLRTYVASKYYQVAYELKKTYSVVIVLMLYAAFNTFTSWFGVNLILAALLLGFMFLTYRETIKEAVAVIGQQFRPVRGES